MMKIEFPVNYVELEDGILDAVGGGAERIQPYSNFNFRVVMDDQPSVFDGKFLSAEDLHGEQP